jgi:transcriptional regulator with XRE-family HTH domain
MKDRIKQYIEHKGITAGELAVILDVQRSNISHILNGRNKPGAAFIEKLLLVFPDLNARWLLTGEGIMNEEALETANTISTQLPLYTETEPEKKAETVEKVEKAEKIERQSVPFVGNEDDVEKMILLFKDGTFATYNNRDKK